MGAAQLQLHISSGEFPAAAAIRWTKAAGTGLSAGREAGQFRSPAAPGTFTKFVKARQRSGDVFGYRIGTKQLGAGLSTAGWSRLRIFVGRYPECGELFSFLRLLGQHSGVLRQGGPAPGLCGIRAPAGFLTCVWRPLGTSTCRNDTVVGELAAAAARGQLLV